MKTLLERARNGERLDDVEIIDMHGHIGWPKFVIPDTSVEGLVELMDRIGIRSIMCSHMCVLSSDVGWGNDELLDAMRRFPGRILGYVSIFPASADTVRAEVERCVNVGFHGIKLHNSNGFAYNDPAYLPAYQIANERRMPALFHTWGQEQELKEIQEISRSYPEMSCLLAHSGAANGDKAFGMARESANIYCELAYSVSPRGLVARAVQSAGEAKVVWGSDGYFFSSAHQIGKVLGADISDETKRKILSGNARRILDRIVRR